LNLLKLDPDLVGQLLLRHADHPPAVADAFSNMCVYGMHHSSLHFPDLSTDNLQARIVPIWHVPCGYSKWYLSCAQTCLFRQFELYSRTTIQRRPVRIAVRRFFARLTLLRGVYHFALQIAKFLREIFAICA
jgi:hypothetical protein